MGNIHSEIVDTDTGEVVEQGSAAGFRAVAGELFEAHDHTNSLVTRGLDMQYGDARKILDRAGGALMSLGGFYMSLASDIERYTPEHGEEGARRLALEENGYKLVEALRSMRRR
jgi:hypothetical protein